MYPKRFFLLYSFSSNNNKFDSNYTEIADNSSFCEFKSAISCPLSHTQYFKQVLGLFKNKDSKMNSSPNTKELVFAIVLFMALLMSLITLGYKKDFWSVRPPWSVEENSKVKEIIRLRLKEIDDSMLISESIERISRNCTFDKINGTIGWQCSTNGECYQLSWLCDNFNQCPDYYDEHEGCNLFEGK